MSNELAESKSAEAVQAASVAAEAIERARQEQIETAVEHGVKPIRDRLDEHLETETKHRSEMKVKIDSLATKDDLDQRFDKIEKFIANVDLTFKIIRGAGTYGGQVLTWLASILIAVGTIVAAFKFGLAGLITWALGRSL